MRNRTVQRYSCFQWIRALIAAILSFNNAIVAAEMIRRRTTRTYASCLRTNSSIRKYKIIIPRMPSLIQLFLVPPSFHQRPYSFLRWSLLLTTASWEICHLLWLQISQNYLSKTVATNQPITHKISHNHLLLITLPKSSLIPSKYLKSMRINTRKTHSINNRNSSNHSIIIIHIS